MRTQLLLPVVLALTGCAASGLTDASLFQASQTVPCADPVKTAKTILTDRDVEVFWGRDRAALRECGARHAALVAALPR